ncbi:MAG: sigma-70 family RNA polymerase sigma factor [Oscillospiraceae bacterium]|nr:sigma-70 family RNA polymerase sigma factor [Oscillospiraceae bacterium]
MDDTEIISLYMQRNELAISETDRKYHGYCMSIARSILRDEQDAAEVVNDAFYAVWNSIPPNEPQTLMGYLGKITRTLCLKRLRTAYTAKRGSGETAIAMDELKESICAADNVEQEIAAKELSVYINAFLRNLPEKERSVFICRYWYFQTIDEIARQYGDSQAKVKSMLFRIRSRLHKYLEKEELL